MLDRPEIPEMADGGLTVHIVSDGGAQDHVLMLAREGSSVRVREWNPSNWSKGPDESVVSAKDLISRLEGIVRKRQRIEPDVRTVRAWLDDVTR